MRIALIVGHIGVGTGATWNDRDEWTMARRAARDLYIELMHNDVAMPLYFEINRRELRWRILGDLLDDRTDDKIKANWLQETRADAVIDFHFNSADDTRAKGHEIIAPEMSRFALCMDAALDMLPNKHRDPIINNGFRLFRKLAGTDIAPVIIEPAFIFENGIDEPEFGKLLTSALAWGIARYAADDLEMELKNDGRL